jgi:hypothetical protein
MKNDLISVSSKIKELFHLHKSGILSNKEYHDQLISQIINQLGSSLTDSKTQKISEKDISASPGKFKIDEFNLFESDITNKSEVQPVNEKVQKILWTLLN